MSEAKNPSVLALEGLKDKKPQTSVDAMHGLSIRLTKNDLLVARLHYSADSERDPELNPQWKQKERKTYTSQASWDREQEIVDEAGGGELVFADTLLTYWSKIVIEDPEWRPESDWACYGGMDHGKTNPTAFERIYVDHQGVIYFCGEYYQPGKEVWQHARTVKKMRDYHRVEQFYADPSIFPATQQQSNDGRVGHGGELAKSLAELYTEEDVDKLSYFRGDRSDISFAERLLRHWSDLENREPTVRIACRNYSDKLQVGLHHWDCPNLLWELMRTRRVKLSAQQLLSRNISEAIVDKDNHARDAAKYA